MTASPSRSALSRVWGGRLDELSRNQNLARVIDFDNHREILLLMILTCIDFACRFENRVPPNRIIAPFNGLARQEIHFTAEELHQFILHGEEVEPGVYPGPKVTIKSRSLPGFASPVATEPNTSTRAMPWRR
jgi:hypothetical protein